MFNDPSIYEVSEMKSFFCKTIYSFHKRDTKQYRKHTFNKLVRWKVELYLASSDDFGYPMIGGKWDFALRFIYMTTKTWRFCIRLGHLAPIEFDPVYPTG